MSNIIRLNETAPNDEWIVMSNQGTDCFLNLLIIAADGYEKTDHQRELVSFLKDQKEINDIAPGTASFDVDEMPWSKDTLSEDVAYMMKTIEKAKTAEVIRKLDYRPDLRIVSPWLDQFSMMIWKLDKDYLYGKEEEELVKQGFKAIQAVLYGEDSSAKRRLLFFLDKYIDPYYQNDLAELYDPLKKLLEKMAISNNEPDVIEEARHLLETYMK